MSRHIVFTSFLVLALAACQPAPPRAAPLTPVTVQLKWTHSAQFAGLYAADQLGYFAAEGLAVSFLEAEPTTDIFAPVVAGTAQFGLANGDAIIASRAAGQPVRAVATILQRSPFVFFALEESGITRPQDFAGKTILVRPRARAVLHAILNRVSLSHGQVTEVSDGDLNELLISGQVDVASGFVTDQVPRLEALGYSVNVIYPHDYGVHIYNDTLFVSDAYEAAHPDRVAGFVNAALRGWAYAIENPAEASQLVLHYAPEADAAFEAAKLRASVPLITGDSGVVGWMTADAWRGMEAMLRSQGVLTQPVDISQVYTLEYIRERGLP